VNWKAQLGIGLLIVAVAVAGVWLWRDSVWKGRIASSPIQRDTTTVVRMDTVVIPVIRTKTIYVKSVDSTSTTPRWWIAKADTVVDGIALHAEYNSPLPLSARGFFSDISIQLPPRIDSVETVYIAEKVTFVVEETNWEGIVIAGSVGMVLGAFLLSLAQ
jgi:hypothetical protein